MSLWIGSQEVGLAPGQTEGQVGGSYVVRPAGSPETEAYIPGTGSTSIMIEGGATAGRGGAGVGETTIVRRDPYGNVLGVKQVGPTGETVFERTSTPRGGYVEAGLPFSIQPRYATIETTRAEMPLYRQLAAPPQVVPVPTAFQLGFVPYGGLMQSRIQQQQYPSTPIDYGRTPVSELTTYPIYRGASFVSRGLQTGFERIVDIQPIPEPIKEAQKGVGSLVTGIPEFVVSGLAGWEYAAREPTVFRTGIVPSVKMFGAGLAEQATERPYYSLGQAAGLAYMFRGGKTAKTPSTEPSTFTKMFGTRQATIEGVKIPEIKAALTPTYQKMFGVSSEAKPISATMPQIREAITPTYAKLFGTRQEPISGASMAEIRTAFTPSLQKIFGRPSTKIETTPIRQYEPPLSYRMFGAKQPKSYFKGVYQKEIAPGVSEFLRSESGELLSKRKPFSRQKLELLPAKEKITPEVEVIDISKLSESQIGIVGQVKPPRYKVAMAPGQKMKMTVYGKRMSIQEPRASLRMRAVLLPESNVVSSQTVSPISRQVSRQAALQYTYQKPIQTPKAISSMLPVSTAIQIPAQRAIQIQRTELISPQKTKITYGTRPRMDFFEPRKTNPQKTTSDIFGFRKRGRKGRRGGFKFPELTRVAAPRQIMKRFKL